jgi:ribosomal protein S18 acetylase RimI-like enzyme
VLPSGVDARGADSTDLPWLTSVDPLSTHELNADELHSVVQRGRVLVAQSAESGDRLGFLRWGLFWDHVPMMNLLWVEPTHRRVGVGRALVSAWERHCLGLGHATVLTSTQSDESAQNFYRRLGYDDAGALVFPGQASELFLVKSLS